MHGDWSSAIEEARRATEILTQKITEPAVGAAYYQLGELYRLKGEFDKAEEAYSQASKSGRNPQPGFSLLRLVQGKKDSAIALIETAVKEANDSKTRSRMLPAYIEIMFTANKIQKACKAFEEFIYIIQELEAPFLSATK